MKTIFEKFKKKQTNNLKTPLFYENYELLEILPTPKESGQKKKECLRQ